MDERRAAQRFRVFKGGTIAFAGGGAGCTVRNLSATGAAIELDGLVALPQSFTLSIASDHSVHRCRTVWRSDKRIGLEFVH